MKYIFLQYVHFDNEPAITHHYQDGPLTDHYDVAKPASNAVYDMKTAKDYDFRHTASHDLDTKHVPVGDYATIRSSHMYNSGRVEDSLTRNSFGERPFYYYDSERQVDHYDNQAFGSTPEKTVVPPGAAFNKHTLKVVDQRNPQQTVEITKDDYIKHVKLAVEKYLKGTEPPSKFHHTKEDPFFKPSKPFHFNHHDHHSDGREEASNVYPKTKLPPLRDIMPPRAYPQPIERPLDYSEGYPLTEESYHSLKENLAAAYNTPIKPVTLPPRKSTQLKRLVASTPNPFMPRPSLPPFGSGKYPPNFKIMQTLRLPKNTFGAGRPMQDSIYNLQENIGHDIDLTTKNLRPTSRPLDMSALEVGQLYPHNNMPSFDASNPISNSVKPKLQFNNQVYHDVNSLMNKNIKQFHESEAAQTYGFQFVDPVKKGSRNRRPSKNSHDSQGSSAHNVAQNTATFNDELENSPIHIINGIAVANPYNIDMDTLQ